MPKRNATFTQKEILVQLSQAESIIDDFLFSETGQDIMVSLSSDDNLTEFARDPSGRFQGDDKNPSMKKQIAAGALGAAALAGLGYNGYRRGYFKKGGMGTLRADARGAGNYIKDKYGRLRERFFSKSKRGNDFVKVEPLALPAGATFPSDRGFTTRPPGAYRQ